MFNLESTLNDLTLAAQHARKRDSGDIADLIEAQVGQLRTLTEFDTVAGLVFNHPDYVVGNVLSRQHVKDHGYDPDSLDPKLADWAADSLADTMWECVAEAQEEI